MGEPSMKRKKIYTSRDLLGLGLAEESMTSEPVIMSSNDQKQQHSAPEDFLRPPQPSFLRPSVSSRDVDAISQGSEAVEGSVISSTTDRYGFLGDHDDPVTKYATPDVDLIRKREAKWLDIARAWIHLCGAKYKMEQTDNKSTFKRLREEKAEQKYVDDIHKDLHRNFPTHELFGGNYEKIGQTELFLVLKAYSVFEPCSRILSGTSSHCRPSFDAHAFRSSILVSCRKHYLGPQLSVFGIFLCVKDVRKKCPSMYETLNVLKNLPESITNEEFLIDQIGKLKITEEDMENRTSETS
ncbi:TBC1D10 [Lepeophtheirus salmonis]|uniref:TBC1D10 n=1 Tax=Lepeophtheirus salmonis TaxID=72036 RepID=A0A7R8CBC8_LEPSM|nr:TBC1D10 [Lepeophtheirus salmonis]CAF2756948.1 TBC1D10 [Lepeophtheirus salmonis]